jgi:hypothetical protein
MNAKKRFIMTLVLAFVFVLVSGSFSAVPVHADPPPDILDLYSIAITPQPDGSLVMAYTLNHYCTNSDWPSDQPYLQIGVPNGSFSITDWGPKDGENKVVNAEALTFGESLVQLDFDENKLPKNGNCFDLFFTITQNKMAYPDPENGNITFAFVPAGWKFPIQVKQLTVTWQGPTDPSLLKLTDPNPSVQNGTTMVWTWSDPVMDASNMFRSATLKFAYDKSAFTLSEAATTQKGGGNGGSSFNWQFCWTVVIIILVVLLILFIIAVISEAYTSGDGVGPAIVTVIDNVGETVSDVLSDGGGFGGSSGHSSSCACAGCACACACAGGGKVGCSRKAIGVACLSKVLTRMKREGGE